MAITKVTGDVLTDDTVKHNHLENRYTATGSITTYTGAVSVDWSSATNFVMGSSLTGAIEWDADNSVFTYSVQNKTYSQTVAELKTQKIENLKHIYGSKLGKTDWYAVRASEGGTAIPSDITTERDDLRTECATKEAEINALSTKSSIVDYQIPSFN